MANTLTPQDVYAIINSIAYQATGRSDLEIIEGTEFTTVGETLIRSGVENVINELSTVLGRTIFAARPYSSKFQILNVDNERWGGMVRKISYRMRDFEQSTDWNTGLDTAQLADGNSVDMYKISNPDAVQFNFYGTKLLQNHITRYRDQFAMAFHNEREFAQFIDGVMVEFRNDIEMMKENRARITLLNFIAGVYHYGGENSIDLRIAFNDEYGTSYTASELLSDHFEEFVKFFIATVNTYSDRLTDRSELYHANVLGRELARFTPKRDQRLILYNPLFVKARANVFPDVFNTEYLDIGDFEGVNYWQSITSPTAIAIDANIVDLTTGWSSDKVQVEIPFVVGMLYDRNALGINNQFDYASTTPFNSAGGYYNIYMHWRFNAWNDFTENAILFTISDR